MPKVEWVWVGSDGKQAGVRISFETGAVQDVAVKDMEILRRKLINADVTSYGVRAKVDVILPRKPLKKFTERPIATYTLMHADDTVCRIYADLGQTEIVNEKKLPFALTGILLTVPRFMDWLNTRIDNLARVYMNQIYIIRKVGRDKEKILRDSCGISPIDNFWICRSDVTTSWDELKLRRDENIELVDIALTGKITSPPNFSEAEKDTTTLFATKGAFPKAIYKGWMLKKDCNAEYEAAAYKLGSFLGVSVAEAVMRQPGIAACRLFTTEAVSMAHARDFLHLTDYIFSTDDEHRAVYRYFEQQGRQDITAQLERLYIFNYLVENMDFHYENFGFLYDSTTFAVTAAAPAYDFNSAFGGYNEPSSYYLWIYEHLPEFISRHKDIRDRLKDKGFADCLTEIDELRKEQKRSITLRAEYLVNL